MAESKVDGAVDDLLLEDGFSIVDSTKTDANTDQSDAKKKASKPAEKKPEAKKEKVEKKEEKKPAPKVEPPKAAPEPEAKPKEPVETEKDDSKMNGHDTKSDALLITTEEDLDMTVDKEKKTESEATEETADAKKDKIDKRKQGDVWVSNITRHVKATDLKKHFSRHGKVLTAKIVTNGKSFFGYILMETAEIASKCVKSLHGSTLDGRKLTVSRQRPDQRKAAANDRKPTVKPRLEKKSEKKPDEKKTESKTSEDKEDKKSEKGEPKIDEALVNARRAQERIRRELDFHKREVARVKRILNDEQRRLRAETQKNRNLNRSLQEAESKLREERRRFDRERELFEKNSRTDRVKLENDRTLIKKELEEVKKLREYLKRKIEEESRPVERRPRASSPYAYSSKRFRDSSGEKPSKYVEERTRTPPSPPKLSSRSKRSPISSYSLEKDRRGTSHHYEVSERQDVGRHSSIVIPSKPSAPAAPRNIWPQTFHQEVWRVGPGSTSTAGFTSGQSYTRQSEYNSGSSSSKGASYSQQRDFSKRDHYSSSSARKY